MYETNVPHYSRHLAAELERRRIANSRYSLRAFAKLLTISPAHLSKVLRGEKGLSLIAAMKITDRLHYSESETRQFCEWVEQAQIQDERLARVMGRSSRSSEADFPPLSVDTFHVVSDWYHCAIRELTECRDFDPDPEALARRLGIRTEEASQALRRLVRAGLLRKVGRTYKKTSASIATPTDQPSQAIRHFHTQMILKARDAIETQTIDERDITGITLAISPEKIPAAKVEIRNFRRRMARFLDSSRPKSVYQLNVQFFRLSQESNSNKKASS